MKTLLILLSLFVGKCKDKQEMVAKWKSEECKHDYLIEIVRSTGDSIKVNFTGTFNADSINYLFTGIGKDISDNDSILRFLVQYNSVKVKGAEAEKINDQQTSAFVNLHFPHLLLGKKSSDGLLFCRITPFIGLGKSEECMFRLVGKQ